MILCISSAVADVEQILISLDKIEDKVLLNIKISNNLKILSGSLIDKFTSKSKLDLSTKNINTHLILLLLKYYNTETKFTHEGNSITVKIIFYLYK